MNLGQAPTPLERFRWTLQLKIKANSSTENQGQLLELIQAPPPRKIQVNPSAEL